jgi:hypothetical protein
MIGMFAMYGYLVYESHALLITQLPDSLIGWQRHTAAWFLSVAIHLTILTTAANSKLVHQAFPVVFAIAGYLITSLFFDAWNFAESQTQDILISQLFSLLIAVINYLFVYLFVGKYQELKTQQRDEKALQQLRQDAVNFKEKAQEHKNTLTNLQDQLTQRSQALTDTKQALTKLQQMLSQQQRTHQEELRLVNENRMCISCGFKAETYQQLSRYKRDCRQCKQQRKVKSKLTNKLPATAN